MTQAISITGEAISITGDTINQTGEVISDAVKSTSALIGCYLPRISFEAGNQESGSSATSALSQKFDLGFGMGLASPRGIMVGEDQYSQMQEDLQAREQQLMELRKRLAEMNDS